MDRPLHTLIIGTGFAGLLMACRLRRAGLTDFLVLEKADTVGGTWRENTYPGAECDVPSALYSYSFAPNPAWAWKFSKQPQILQYLNDFADREGLRPHILHGQTVQSLHWRDDTKTWRVETDSDTFHARHVVSAVGQLHIPNTPDFPGMDDFRGPSFHTAAWDHSIPYTGRNVAVIGSAASAIQVIPAIAPDVARLTVYQRSPNWVIKKPDRPYTRAESALLKRLPALSKLYRFGLWAQGEYGLWPTIRGNPLTRSILRLQNRWLMRKAGLTPDMRARLTPDYPMGAKRILLSSEIYPALARPNVELVFDPIETFTGRGIHAGRERPHDLVVFATGFHTNPFLKHIDVRGRGGVSLHEHWSEGAHAYLGVSTAGFPNFHMLYGPNTNTGHTSIVLKLEAQAGYILQLIQATGEGALTVRAGEEAIYNEEVQTRLRNLAFSKIEASWYKDGDRVTNNWMGGSREFRRRLRTPDLSKFERA